MGFLDKQTDRNYVSIADNRMPDVRIGNRFDPEKPELFDDILKLSNAWAVNISDCVINPNGGNREDGIDMARYCRDVIIKDCKVGPGAKYAVTIKGGSHHIVLENITITGERGKEGVDIDIGNFSDWNYAMTHSIDLINVKREDGRPVTLRIGRAEGVNIIGGNIKLLFVQSFFLKAYVWAKFWLQHFLNPKK